MHVLLFFLLMTEGILDIYDNEDIKNFTLIRKFCMAVTQYINSYSILALYYCVAMNQKRKKNMRKMGQPSNDINETGVEDTEGHNERDRNTDYIKQIITSERAADVPFVQLDEWHPRITQEMIDIAKMGIR